MHLESFWDPPTLSACGSHPQYVKSGTLGQVMSIQGIEDFQGGTLRTIWGGEGGDGRRRSKTRPLENPGFPSGRAHVTPVRGRVVSSGHVVAAFHTHF